MLTSLPPEIVSLILLWLDPEDIVNLAKTIPLDITRDVYNSAFRDDTRFSHYDLRMFEQRARSSLHIIGDPGRWTGEFDKDIPLNYEFVLINQVGTVRRMWDPYRVKGDGMISQVSLAREGLYLLKDGEIYMSRTFHKNPYTREPEPYLMTKAFTRERLEDDWDADRYETHRIHLEELREADLAQYEERRENDPEFESDSSYENMLQAGSRERMPEPCEGLLRRSAAVFGISGRPRFVEVSSSDKTYAVDSQGLLWKWGNLWDFDDSPFQGIPLCLIENGKTLGRIICVRVGTCFTTCLVEGVGVVKLTGKAHLDLTEPNGIRSGFPCLDDHLCYSEVETVPDTQGVSDYQVLDFSIVYLSHGTLKSAALDEYHNPPDVTEVNSLGPFVQLRACHKQIGLVTTDGRVVIVNVELEYREYKLTPRVFDIPKVVSLAVGWYHCLVLTDEGEVYVWGGEPNVCGCLGLGALHVALKMDDTRLGQDNWGVPFLFLDKPTKVKLPGKACGIFAQEAYSGVLVDDEE